MELEVRVRAIHIFSDHKFIPWVRASFTRPGWSSMYIVLDRTASQVTVAPDTDIVRVPVTTAGLQWIRETLQDADFAFHHLLDNIKAEIIVECDSRARHFWCFFGAEVYQQTPLFRQVLYGPATRRMQRFLPEIRFRYALRRFYYRWVRRERAPLESLRRAIPRITALLWYVEDEIAWIRQRMELPPFSYFQFFRFEDIIPDEHVQCDRSSRRILIGNSATVENNHLDVLEVLRALPLGETQYTLPLTYGQFPRYRRLLEQKWRSALGERVTFLGKHLPLEAYYALLLSHPTAIFLHRRQQALGNIFYLLYGGAKVYLSRHNIIFSWLKKHGLAVFAFETEFQADFLQGQLTLPDDRVHHNREAIRDLLSHDRNESFFQALEAMIRADG